MPCKFGDECRYAHGRTELRKWRAKAGLPEDDLAGDEGEGEQPAAAAAAAAAVAAVAAAAANDDDEEEEAPSAKRSKTNEAN